MIIIKVNQGENIDRAIKRFRRKLKNIKLVPELRERKQFTKKSIKRRRTIQLAEYKEKYLRSQSDF